MRQERTQFAGDFLNRSLILGHRFELSKPSLSVPKASLLKPLTLPAVERAVEKIVSTENELVNQIEKSKGLLVEPLRDWETTLSALDIDASTFLATKTPWYFGMSIVDVKTREIVGIFTYYIAYSSWNGRILYVDRLDTMGDEETEQILLQLLAQIAVDLGCARITWRVRLISA